MTSENSAISHRRRVSDELLAHARGQYDSEIKRRDDIYASLTVPVGIVAAIGTMIAIFVRAVSEFAVPVLVAWHRSRPGDPEDQLTLVAVVVRELMIFRDLTSFYVIVSILAIFALTFWSCLSLLSGVGALKGCAVGVSYEYAALDEEYAKRTLRSADFLEEDGRELPSDDLERMSILIKDDLTRLLLRCAVHNAETNQARLFARVRAIDYLTKGAYGIGMAYFCAASAWLVLSIDVPK